jgi:hypothetical protein
MDFLYDEEALPQTLRQHYAQLAAWLVRASRPREPLAGTGAAGSTIQIDCSSAPAVAAPTEVIRL